MLIALVLALAAAILITGFAFLQIKAGQQARQEIDTLNKNLLLELKRGEEARIHAAALGSKLQSAEKQLLVEKQMFTEQKKVHTETLDLIGKDMISRGSQIMKEENAVQLSQLLQPFKDKLDVFEKEVQQTRLDSATRHSSLESVIRMLTEKHDQMNSTAQNLVDALRGENKIQGNWGELALERILELSGLHEGQEYSTQGTFRGNENQQLRPDVIIHLPENKQLIIDAKVSLKAFERYVNETDLTVKAQALRAHIESVKAHIRSLSSKDYTAIPDVHTLEFVLMFIPLESSFALAVQEEPGLYELALDKKIVMVTPSTLLATLKTISSIWKNEMRNRYTIEIAEEAGKMYDKLVAFIGDMEKVASKQMDAVKAHEEAMSKLHSGRGNLVSKAEKMRKLGAKASKNIDSKYLDDRQLDDVE